MAISESRPAAFGPRILTPPGLLGYVLPLSSFAFHCPGEPDRRPDRSETWVALVQRGECSFVDKVREAQKFGARGVIVGGSEDTTDGDDLITMYSTTRSDDITIPSTYITHASYKSLMGLIQVSNTTISGLRTVSLLMGSEEIWQWPLLTISLLLLLPSIMTLATLLIHRIRQARSERRERAPEDIVHSLPTGVWTGEGVEFHNAEKEAGVIAHKLESAPTPTSSAAAAPPSSPPPSISHHVPVNGRGRKYLKKAWFAEQSECAICLSDFEKGDQLRILPCGHIFHQDEVDAWLIQRKKLCPVCKADITVVSRPPSIRSSSTPQLTTSTPSSPIPEVFGQYISFPVPLTPPVVNPPPTESSPLLGQNR
ncbi:hypothetical protein BS47DRAFT_1373759 [Hydnum rufescens UP504]|uniref:RING-type E3 ubiquitin transferase n=1 Tax=Hydnum rufescens UP504 TaxID=1448309 RepID=A0A9P6DR29_9AGAM|nr:hypothetical protein BS47DRAFT_1373759 [Hydnum rufescens UP504]